LKYAAFAVFLAVGSVWAIITCSGTATAEPTERHLTVSREDARSFKLSRPGSPTVRVTFLTADTFRLHVLPDEEDDVKLPEYMVAKSEASYPPVAVRAEPRNNEVVFRTAAVAVRLVAQPGVISADLRSTTKVLIRDWKIYACCRTARLESSANESIYGFGDKRAPLEHRGQRVQMLDRDAFASETNKSYKSVPFS